MLPTDGLPGELLRKHRWVSEEKRGMSSCERKAETFPVACVTKHLKFCNTLQISSSHFIESQHGHLHRDPFPSRKSTSSKSAGMIRRVIKDC